MAGITDKLPELARKIGPSAKIAHVLIELPRAEDSEHAREAAREFADEANARVIIHFGQGQFVKIAPSSDKKARRA